jgi:DNA modification methylase
MELNKIYNGNCFDLFEQLEDKSIDVVFTSPPYNRKRNDKYTFYNDTLVDYYSFLMYFIEESRRVAKDKVIVNIQTNYYNQSEVYHIIGTYADMIKQIIIWEKTNPMPASGYNITNAYEMFLVIGDKPLKSNTTYTKNVISTSVNSSMPKEHKAVMKQEVSDWFIEKFTSEGNVILDPFMGIGTTAISCKKMNRKYIGFEMIKKYCEMAEKRIENA